VFSDTEAGTEASDHVSVGVNVGEKFGECFAVSDLADHSHGLGGMLPAHGLLGNTA
jgi:hypothetical protein